MKAETVSIVVDVVLVAVLFCSSVASVLFAYLVLLEMML
jgi:hypothetical protein